MPSGRQEPVNPPPLCAPGVSPHSALINYLYEPQGGQSSQQPGTASAVKPGAACVDRLIILQARIPEHMHAHIPECSDAHEQNALPPAELQITLQLNGSLRGGLPVRAGEAEALAAGFKDAHCGASNAMLLHARCSASTVLHVASMHAAMTRTCNRGKMEL